MQQPLAHQHRHPHACCHLVDFELFSPPSLAWANRVQEAPEGSAAPRSLPLALEAVLTVRVALLAGAALAGRDYSRPALPLQALRLCPRQQPAAPALECALAARGRVAIHDR